VVYAALAVAAPPNLRINRDHRIQASNGSGFEVRWHVGGPWPAEAPAAIGALRGFHHATLEPSATWPMHIQENLQVTYVVAGALEHIRLKLLSADVRHRDQRHQWHAQFEQPAADTRLGGAERRMQGRGHLLMRQLAEERQHHRMTLGRG